jgi:hypothetical protein
VVEKEATICVVDGRNCGNSMTTVYKPIASAEEWREFLAQPDLHWKTGYSARTFAHCWQDAATCDRGVPEELRTAFDSVERLRGLEALIALPEHKVPLPGGTRSSQTDLWLLGRTSSDLVSVAIEAKAREDFGPVVSRWIAEADVASGKRERLTALRNTLQLADDLSLDAVRYQLLHRAASAIIEARRFHAPIAVMLVHAFGGESDFAQYREFARLFDVEVAEDRLVQVPKLSGPELFLGWVRGADRWLTA